MANSTSTIPSAWKITNLAEVAEIIGGGTPKTDVEEYWNGDIPWLSVIDFNNDSRWVYKTEKHITKEGLENSSTRLLNTTDIIISARGTVGAFAQLKIPMAFNQSCYGLRAKETSENDFLYYLLKQNIQQVKRNVHGAVFDTITRDTFDQIEVSLPTLPEQSAISAILSSLDNKIELLHEQNITLETTVQAIFKEWFVNFNFPDSTGKMIDSERGEIPEGWSVGKLVELGGQITDYVANGSFASLKENVTLYDTPNYALFLRNTDLKSNFAQKVYVDEHSYNFLKKTQLHGGEIVISNVGDVGSVYLCPYFNIPMVLGNNTISLKSEYQSYFYTLFTNRVGQFLINSITGGSAQPKFNKTDFRNMKMVIPAKIVLKNFEALAGPLYSKTLKNDAQIQTISILRDSLLPRLMKGELRVKGFNN